MADDSQALITMVDDFVRSAAPLVARGHEGFGELRTLFSAFKSSFIDDLVHGQFTPSNLDYLGDINERLYWTCIDEWPTDEALSDGIISIRQFLRWLTTERPELGSRA